MVSGVSKIPCILLRAALAFAVLLSTTTPSDAQGATCDSRGVLCGSVDRTDVQARVTVYRVRNRSGRCLKYNLRAWYGEDQTAVHRWSDYTIAVGGYYDWYLATNHLMGVSITVTDYDASGLGCSP